MIIMYIPIDKSQRISQISTDIQDYVKQNGALFITGQKSLDNDWAAYIKGFDGFGLNEYLETLRATEG